MRTDSGIRADVESALRWDPSLDEKCIAVEVDMGLVTLRGTVRHHSDRIAAQEVAKRVIGVHRIANEVAIKMPQPSERSDTDLSQAALHSLRWNVGLESTDVKAVVEAGWITLSGHVTNGFQSTVAESAVRHLIGVKGVINKLIVQPIADACDVKAKIEESFKRHAALDAKDVRVNVNGSAVELEGTVHSWREKDDAAVAAWSAPGVATVENKLQVHS